MQFRIHDADACLGDNAGQVTSIVTLTPALSGTTDPLQTVFEFLGSVDFGQFIDSLGVARDIVACALDTAEVIVVYTKTFAIVTTPEMAQDCAGAFQPIIDLLNKHKP